VKYHEFFIGWRYLRARPFQTGMSITGVVLGIVVLVVTYSIWTGLEEALRARLLGSEAHVEVGKMGGLFTDYEKFIAAAEELPEIVAGTPSVVSEVLLQNRASKRRKAGAQVRGVDPARAGAVARISEYLASGELVFDRPELIAEGKSRLHDADTVVGGIIVGSGLAMKLRLSVGDPVMMYATFHERGTAIYPVMRTFVVVDTYESGLYEIDASVAYIDFAVAQDIFDYEGAATVVQLRVAEPNRAGAAKQAILQRFGLVYNPRTWQEMRGAFFYWLRLEKIGAMIIFGAIVLVAGFSIAIALVMLVREKTREIGILRAMGLGASGIRRVFMLHGTVIGVLGVLIGTAIGLAICVIVMQLKVGLPGDVYQIEYVPVLLSWRFILLVDGSSFVMCLGMSLLPASRAANLRPVEALRYE
jgi:lipoprotein-releasing system permease protein